MRNKIPRFKLGDKTAKKPRRTRHSMGKDGEGVDAKEGQKSHRSPKCVKKRYNNIPSQTESGDDKSNTHSNGDTYVNPESADESLQRTVEPDI